MPDRPDLAGLYPRIRPDAKDVIFQHGLVVRSEVRKVKPDWAYLVLSVQAFAQASSSQKRRATHDVTLSLYTARNVWGFCAAA